MREKINVLVSLLAWGAVSFIVGWKFGPLVYVSEFAWHCALAGTAFLAISMAIRDGLSGSTKLTDRLWLKFWALFSAAVTMGFIVGRPEGESLDPLILPAGFLGFYFGIQTWIAGWRERDMSAA